MDVGGVGGLRNVKSAISVARKVLEHTKHSLLGGDLATDFAVNMGFKKESLQTDESKEMWTQWKENKCQPNFWKVLERERSHAPHLATILYSCIFRMSCQTRQPPADHIARTT